MHRSQRVCFRGVCSCLAAGPLESGRYMAGLTPGSYALSEESETAGRHPCSTAWRDVQGGRPAVLHPNFMLLKLKISNQNSWQDTR